MFVNYFFRILSIIDGIIYKVFHLKSFYIKNILRSRLNYFKIFKIYNGGKIIINGKINARKNVIISSDSGHLDIGKDFFINYNSMLFCHKKIKIGNNVSIGSNCCIYDHDHAFNENGKIKSNKDNIKYKMGDVIIGNNVWIGSNTVILRNTIIGDNCVIGAGAVIKGQIPPNSIVKTDRKILVEKLEKNRQNRGDKNAKQESSV